MKDNIFKTLFLISAVCAIVLLYGIYQKNGNNRFQAIAGSDGGINVLDTYNGRVYFQDEERYYYIENGKTIYIRAIPND